MGIRGQGDAGSRGGPSGDLIVNITVKDTNTLRARQTIFTTNYR